MDLEKLASSIVIDPLKTCGPKSQIFVDAIRELNTMIGLDKIKLQLSKHIQHAMKQLERGNIGGFHNIIITGEQGRGKSELAVRIGRVFSAMCYFNRPEETDDEPTKIEIDRKELIKVMNYFRINLKKISIRRTTTKARVLMMTRKRKLLKRLSQAMIHRTYYSIPGIIPLSAITVRRIINGYYDESGSKIPDKYNIIGLLEKSEVREKIGLCKVFNKSDLVGKYVGHTAPKTTAALKECLGGCAIVDECYSLLNTKDHVCTFGIEALNTINQYMSEHPLDQMVIFCGYRDMVAGLYENQRGLYRRFNWVYNIEDYTPKELTTIFMSKLPKELKTNLPTDEVEEIFKNSMKLFKNSAGDIVNLCTYCEIEMDYQNDNILTIDHLIQGINVLQEKKNAQDGTESKGDYSHIYL